MTLSIPDSRIFEWLGNDDEGRPYYLKALKLYSDGDEQVEAAMKRFLEVAKRLEAEPNYWSEILRTPAWRHTLIGCVCILVTRNQSYFQDLAFSFKQGNWIAPQIAVTIGIVYPYLAHGFFSEYLSLRTSKQYAKEFVSAQCVLAKLDAASFVNEFESNFKWSKYNCDIAKAVVDRYWIFWSHNSRARYESNFNSDS